MNKKKIYIVGKGGSGYLEAFDPNLFVLSPSLEESDMLLFTGGEDVSPSLYGADKHKYTMNNSERDKVESSFFEWARDNNKLMVGICRGSQLLCALSGGKLVQHCENHTSPHRVMDHKGLLFKVTSTHHQMMHPYNLDVEKYDLLAWAFPSRVTDRWLDNETKSEMHYAEPEIVWFKETKALAVQGHPEHNDATQDFKNYFNGLILSKLK